MNEKYYQLAEDLHNHLRDFSISADFANHIDLPQEIKLRHEIKEIYIEQTNTILQEEMKKWCAKQKAGKSWENVIKKITNTVKEYEISQAQVEVPWARQAQTPVARQISADGDTGSQTVRTVGSTPIEEKKLFTKGIVHEQIGINVLYV